MNLGWVTKVPWGAVAKATLLVAGSLGLWETTGAREAVMPKAKVEADCKAAEVREVTRQVDHTFTINFSATDRALLAKKCAFEVTPFRE